MLTNYHSHSLFSDGSAEPETLVNRAIEAGMAAFGFSCHAPVPFPQNWCIREENLEAYLAETNRLKKNYQGKIELYVGLEVDFVPGKSSVLPYAIYQDALDYTIGSVHYLDYFPDGTPCNIDGRPDEFARGLEQIWHGDVRLAVSRYFETMRRMLREAPPDIVGHIDKIRMHNRNACLFDPEEKWYVDEVEATLGELRKSGCIMEINTRALYKGGFEEPYPDHRFYSRCRELGIPVMINTDAHHPEDILKGRQEAIGLLLRHGLREQTVFLGGKPVNIPLE